MHAPHRPPRAGHLLSDNTLHVIAVCSNPARYSSRYRLHEAFAAYMDNVPQVELYVVEAAYGDRHHEVTVPEHPNHLQVRHKTEVWNKENLINLGVKHLLPADWKYMAWIDADVEPLNNDWAQETLHQLQAHPVVQLFENVIDLGPRNNVVQTHQGFAKLYRTGQRFQRNATEPYQHAHSGYAWACTRTWWENVGGLLDRCILGSADHHMAWAMIGEAQASVPRNIHPNYSKMIFEWEKRCERALGRNLGFVEGALKHFWHGPKAKRFYRERWSILYRNNYDPEADVAYNDQGVLELVSNKPGFKRDLQDYFRARDEDSRSDA
jgi:hypothetical protein